MHGINLYFLLYTTVLSIYDLFIYFIFIQSQCRKMKIEFQKIKLHFSNFMKIQLSFIILKKNLRNFI